MNKALKIVLSLLVVLLLLAGGASFYVRSANDALDPNDTDTINITIESGSSTTQIAETLKDAGLIDDVNKYKIISKIWGFDGKYMAGNYTLSPSMSKRDIADILIRGSNNLLSFTVPEGLTIYQVADRLSEEGFVDKAKFISELEKGDFSSYRFLDGAQSGNEHLEGYLFPNTYSLDAAASERDYITMMLDQFGEVFTEEYEARAAELGFTPNEIIIIASLIEREAQVAEDRPKVASVVYNRLKIGMPLQFCSSIQYILGENKELLTYEDTAIESPYNTYINTGLPPGPICSPGEAAINAALYPDDTEYLYFVLSEKLDGSHNFSVDIDEFERNKAAYYEAYEANESGE